MIHDPCLWEPDTCWVKDLFKESRRLYLLRYPIPLESPLETEPLKLEIKNKQLAILCTERHLESALFKGYMRSTGANENQWTTISFSNFESFFFQILVLKKKRPEISGILVDPPKSGYTAIRRGAGADVDMVLMLPERETIINYLVKHNMSLESILDLESQITGSIFGRF